MNTKPTLSKISKLYGITIKEIKEVVDKHHFATLDDMDIVKIIDTFGVNDEVSNLLSAEEEVVDEEVEVEVPEVIEDVIVEDVIELKVDDLVIENNKPDWCTDIQWLMFDTGVYNMDINPDKE